MELDKRIIDGKKPLDCFDTEIAKQFIGKKGYFSNYLNVYTNLCNMEEGVLHSLDEQHGEAFVEEYAKWKFFLPAEWVKEPEKKYRPFKDHTEYKEYLNDGIIESWIQIREKLTGEVSELMYVGGSGAIICLGAYSFDLNQMFYDFELFNESTGEWQPFGVMEDD